MTTPATINTLTEQAVLWTRKPRQIPPLADLCERVGSVDYFADDSCLVTVDLPIDGQAKFAFPSIGAGARWARENFGVRCFVV